MAGKKGNKSKLPGSSASNQSSSAPSSGKLKGAQSINVRHILCKKHSTMQNAILDLRGELTEEEKERGMDPDKKKPQTFDAVAKKYSDEKNNQGGSLGWKTKGSLIAEFEKVAFDIPPSTVAKPIWKEAKTTEGYHLIMVEGRK